MRRSTSAFRGRLSLGRPLSFVRGASTFVRSTSAFVRSTLSFVRSALVALGMSAPGVASFGGSASAMR